MKDTIKRFCNISAKYLYSRFEWIIIFIGIALRAARYLSNPSLWLDEAYHASLIMKYPFFDFSNPFVPAGYLFIERLLVKVFGTSEYSLRLFPFICGILSVILFYRFIKDYLSRKAILFALSLFSLCEPLIYFSYELKQYSSDVLCTLILYIMAHNIRQQERINVAEALLYIITGTIIIWFSHPALFVSAGIMTVLVISAFRQNNFKKMLTLIGIGSIWGVSFLLNYFMILKNYHSYDWFINTYMNNYMPLLPLSLRDFRWFVSVFFNFFKYMDAFPLSGIAVLTVIIGAYEFLKRDKIGFYIITTPILLTLFASGLHKYPFTDRLILFLWPAVLCIMAEGLEQILIKTKKIYPILGWLIVILLFFHPLIYETLALINPPRKEEIAPVISYIKNKRQPADIIYVYAHAEVPFEYYASKFGFKKKDYIIGVKAANNLDRYVHNLDKLRGNKRVWVLFSHVRKDNGIDEEKYLLHYLDKIGRKIDSYKAERASVYLYYLNKN